MHRLIPVDGLPFQPKIIHTKKHHDSESLSGWLGLSTWMVQDDKGYLWDVDWRYAFGSEVFQQHWVDFGWDEEKLLYRKKHKDPTRHKAIVYICAQDMKIPENYSSLAEIETNINPETERSSGLLESPFWHSIPERYLLAKYWQSTYRGLIPLEKLPQELQELLPETLPTASENTHGDFSTTRNLHETPPVIISQPEEEVQIVLTLRSHPQRKGEGGLRTKGDFKHPGNDEKRLISVVTVVYNNVSYLEQTIQSVINQSTDHVEYIVIDGKSTDGTLELIQQYDEQIDYWVSEPDEGIYDAMNKAIKVASGDYMMFMNSGDLFFSCRSIESFLKQDKKRPELVAGRCVVINDYVSWLRPNLKSVDIHKFSHQSMLFKTDIIRMFYYSTEFLVAADTHLTSKIQGKYGFDKIDSIISIFRLDGVSSSIDDCSKLVLLIKERKSNNASNYVEIVGLIAKYIMLKLLPNRVLYNIVRYKNLWF
jgi:hypothetical protein